MRISDWSSDVCSSDLQPAAALLVRFLNSPMEPILSYGCTKHSKRWSGPISRRAKRVPRSQAPARENRKKSGRRRTPQLSDRKSTRLNPVTHAHLVCRRLLETTKTQLIKQTRGRNRTQ